MVALHSERALALVMVHVMLLGMVAGCIGALDTTVDPRATLEAYPTLIQEGEMVTLDARESSPVEGVITKYEWDFGDGTTAETVIGFTSHTYLAYGQYTVRITVTNDQGGTDDALATIVVNGAPVVNISMPATVRAGDAALLDASNSYDPEGNPLTFAWDLNTLVDSDGDGDSSNDADETTETVLLDTSTSGLIYGSLRVDDGAGAFAVEPFEINVTTRTFKVTWITETYEVSWDEYLDQGDSWSGNMTPGDIGRVLSFNAVLELDQDVAPPHDNFTLGLNIVEDNYNRRVATEPGNYSTNEPARAEMAEDEMNERGEDGLYTSDSAEALLRLLLNSRDSGNGQGTWVWTVVAQQSDPDAFIGEIDPDPGNDWTLTVEVVVMRPSLTEVALGNASE
ncbi:MAG: PKD domain-containing protein [Candidatus Thermoplasmatota archaeon]|nr:PKD domain-containing protein [Candidatus Thermoplasmatota archaeon]